LALVKLDSRGEWNTASTCPDQLGPSSRWIWSRAGITMTAWRTVQRWSIDQIRKMPFQP
jgi:hypothetical protein